MGMLRTMDLRTIEGHEATVNFAHVVAIDYADEKDESPITLELVSGTVIQVPEELDEVPEGKDEHGNKHKVRIVSPQIVIRNDASWILVQNILTGAVYLWPLEQYRGCNIGDATYGVAKE